MKILVLGQDGHGKTTFANPYDEEVMTKISTNGTEERLEKYVLAFIRVIEEREYFVPV